MNITTLKRLAVAALAASVLAGCTPLTRQPGSYIGISVGRSAWNATGNKYQLEADSQTGYAGAVEAGRFWSHGRVGVELSGRQNDVHGVNGHAVRGDDGTCIYRTKGNGRCAADADGNKLAVFTLHAVGIYEPWEWHGFRPYVLGGAGASLLWARSVDVPPDNVSVSGVGIGPSAQVGAGISYEVASQIDVDLGYRALWVATTKVDGLSTHYRSQGAMLSVRLRLRDPE
jgi:opacity protein-like surface antigen